MAQTIPTQRPQIVDLADDENLAFWQRTLGVTAEQLLDAVHAAGPNADDIVEHFLTQGSSAGAS